MELLNIQSFDKKETNGSEESHISLDDEELNNSAGFYRAIDNEIIPEAPLSFNFDDTWTVQVLNMIKYWNKTI